MAGISPRAGTIAHNNSPYFLLQLTDAHLLKDTQHTMLGINTTRSLERVIEHIEQQQYAIDGILVSGDIAQEPHVSVYERFYRLVDRLQAPQFWLSGNHDLIAVVQATTNLPILNAPTCIQLNDHWRLITLTSNRLCRIEGHLSDQDLDWLNQTLAENPQQHTLIALHHHPILVQSPWLDQHSLQKAEQFWNVLQSHEACIKGIIHGHVHQEFHAQYRDIPVWAAPSTGFQFKPQALDFAVDDIPPGYRWFELYADGPVKTGVVRLNHAVGQVDLQSEGY